MTGLQLSIDWTSIIKLLFTKLFPLTPLPLPLSLSPSVNFFVFFVSSYNLSYHYLYFEYKIPSCYSVLTLLFVSRMKQSSKQGVEKEVTPTGSSFFKDFSKDSSSTSIPIYSQAIIPYPSSPRASFFKGSNITNFLDSYSQMCTNYQVDKLEKIKQLS